jgi:CBS domain-containing protein
MSLHRFCKRPAVALTPEHTIREVCQLMREHNIGCLLVTDAEGRLSGILTDRDIALRVTGEGKDPQLATVQGSMTPNPVRIPVDRSLHELITLMHSQRVRRIPIIDREGKPIGIVTLDDLLVLLGDEMSELGKTVAETFLRKPSTAGAWNYHWWATSA